MMPNRTLGNFLEDLSWKRFHKNLLGKCEGLDKIISVLQHLVTEAQNSNFFIRTEQDSYVTNLDLFTHFLNFLRLKINDYDFKTIEEKNKFVMDTTKEMLYSLESIKKEEAFLVPDKSRELTGEFLNQLNRLPHNYQYL